MLPPTPTVPTPNNPSATGKTLKVTGAIADAKMRAAPPATTGKLTEKI